MIQENTDNDEIIVSTIDYKEGAGYSVESTNQFLTTIRVNKRPGLNI